MTTNSKEMKSIVDPVLIDLAYQNAGVIQNRLTQEKERMVAMGIIPRNSDLGFHIHGRQSHPSIYESDAKIFLKGVSSFYSFGQDGMMKTSQPYLTVTPGNKVTFYNEEGAATPFKSVDEAVEAVARLARDHNNRREPPRPTLRPTLITLEGERL
jgi:hypothetical protein